MRLVLSQKGWCKMSDANQRIKALQEKLRPLGDELETRQAELEELSKTAYQDFQNAEEAERTCFFNSAGIEEAKSKFLAGTTHRTTRLRTAFGSNRR